MSKTALRIAGISLAAALAGATSAHAQVLVHKDLSLAMATTIALTAVENCKAAGYNVSVHVMGRNGEVLVALRNDKAGPNTFENSMKKAYTARTFRIRVRQVRRERRPKSGRRRVDARQHRRRRAARCRS